MKLELRLDAAQRQARLPAAEPTVGNLACRNFYPCVPNAVNIF
jgi:hypothetical protein